MRVRDGNCCVSQQRLSIRKRSLHDLVVASVGHDVQRRAGPEVYAVLGIPEGTISSLIRIRELLTHAVWLRTKRSGERRLTVVGKSLLRIRE